MSGAEPCAICSAAASAVIACDATVMLIRHGARLALAPRRHVARWRDLSADERAALAEQLGPAQAQLERTGTVAPVTLVEDGGHVHFRIEAPRAETGPLPGLPHDGPLISGGTDALHGHLLPWIDAAAAIDLSVSFLMASGLQLVLPHLEDLLARGGRLRLLAGDYLDVTEPDALRRIADLEGDRALHIFEAARIPFHPKAWMFGFPRGDGALIVGPSNLSRAALTEGVEWNLRHFGPSDGAPLVAARTAFDALLARPEVRPLTTDWIERYEKRRHPPAP